MVVPTARQQDSASGSCQSHPWLGQAGRTRTRSTITVAKAHHFKQEGHPNNTLSVPKGHPKDTLGISQRYPKDTRRTTRGHPNSTRRTPQGYPNNTPRIPEGHPEDTPIVLEGHLMDNPIIPEGHPGKEEGAQPRFHVWGAWRRSSITSPEIKMTTRVTRSEARRKMAALQGADPRRGLRTRTRGEL